MLHKLMHTDDDVSRMVLRVLLGVVFLPHGAQKLFGWFGGFGFSATMDFFTTKAGIPALFAFLAIMAESVGAAALIAGFLTRVAAFGIGLNMVICAMANHVQHGFFMNWFGNQKGEGYEYHILVVAIAVALMIRGGGRWSVDAVLSRKGGTPPGL